MDISGAESDSGTAQTLLDLDTRINAIFHDGKQPSNESKQSFREPWDQRNKNRTSSLKDDAREQNNDSYSPSSDVLDLSNFPSPNAEDSFLIVANSPKEDKSQDEITEKKSSRKRKNDLPSDPMISATVMNNVAVNIKVDCYLIDDIISKSHLKIYSFFLYPLTSGKDQIREKAKV